MEYVQGNENDFCLFYDIDLFGIKNKGKFCKFVDFMFIRVPLG